MADEYTKSDWPKLQALLKEQGRWFSFVAYRNFLYGKGRTPGWKTTVLALRAFPLQAPDDIPAGFEHIHTHADVQRFFPAKAEKVASARGSLPPPENDEDDTIDGIDLSLWEGRPAIPWVEEMRWVYNHLYVDRVCPQDAPSPGSWGYLQQLRGDLSARAVFYNQLLPKLAAQESPDPSSIRGDDNIGDLRKYLSELLMESA